MSGAYTWPGKAPAKRNLALEANEREVTENPEHYVASIFRGIGKFERIECATLDFARTAARTLIAGGNRPASIYAVKGPRDVLVETVQPQKGPPNGPQMGSRTHTTQRKAARIKH
jgi:hypothetical protein